MIKQAYIDGGRAALKRFNVREASSIMDLLLGIGTPMAARAGLNVMAPRLMPTIEKSLEVPFRGLKNIGQGAMRAVRGPSTPADALMRGLSGTPTPGPIRDPAAMIAAMPGGRR